MRRWRPALVALGLGALLSCNQEGDTIINNINKDCFLVRDDLIGDWRVFYTDGGSRNYVNCTGKVPSLTGTVTVPSSATTYAGVDVLGSDGSTSFRVIGFDGSGLNTFGDLLGSVEADSCLALFRAWEKDEAAYVQCIGTFDRGSRTITGACDSAEIDTDLDDLPDTSCSLSSDFGVAVDLL